jgi:hypothetical protein
MSGISCFVVIEGIILRSILILVIISFLLLLYVEQSTNNDGLVANGLVAHDFTDLSHNLNTFYLPSDFFPYIRTAGNRSMGS